MKNLYLFCLTFALISCSENKDSSRTNITGNWSYLDLDSEYYELLIDSSKMTFFDESSGFLAKRNYNFKKDSLFIYLSGELKSTKPYLFRSSGKKVYLLDETNSDTLVRMKRIDASEFTFNQIKNFDDEAEKLKFSVAYHNRRNAFLGIDTYYDLDSIINLNKNIKFPDIIEIDEY